MKLRQKLYGIGVWFKEKWLGIWQDTWSGDKHWLTRFVFFRFLGVVYFFAFLSLALQVLPLLGEKGITPVAEYLQRVGTNFGSDFQAFLEKPTVFWFHLSDTTLWVLAWLGVLLSLVLTAGYANLPLTFLLWFIYLSFVNVGQVWYGYGWEIQLLETGFLAMLLAPLWDARPFSRESPRVPVIWMLRLLAFKVHLGAGLIKARGDECWDKLTCLFYHYETQPIPNPLSPWFHQLPNWFHKFSTALTHFVQSIAPFAVFLGRKLRNWAGVLMIAFQLVIMTTGNYAFLNIVTIAAALAYFDDDFLKKILPQKLIDKAERAKEEASKPSMPRKVTIGVIVLILLAMNAPVFINLASPDQAMNTAFNEWNIVGSYGAFGSVGQERPELVVEGTHDTNPSARSEWREYDFVAKPTNVSESLPVIAPYQPRVDWQIWFAAMQSPRYNPWLIHMVWKLLENDPAAVNLVEENPFPDKPPNYIRIVRYKYEFKEPWKDKVWKRERIGRWLPPISRQNKKVRELVRERYGG